MLDLFSGIGGFSLGLERAGMETVAFCEIDEFCQKVLKKHWPEVPIYDDIRELDYDGAVDLICGGFPCQPFSLAGKRGGEEDDRHLWPFMFSLIQKHRPAWVIGENVAGFVDMALDNLLTQMEGENYQCRAFIIPACAINAIHRRDRVWIIANDNSKRGQGGRKKTLPEQQILSWSENVRRFTNKNNRPNIHTPKLCRRGDGVSQRLDALGNAVVPQIPEIIGRAIMEIETYAETTA